MYRIAENARPSVQSLDSELASIASDICPLWFPVIWTFVFWV